MKPSIRLLLGLAAIGSLSLAACSPNPSDDSPDQRLADIEAEPVLDNPNVVSKLTGYLSHARSLEEARVAINKLGSIGTEYTLQILMKDTIYRADHCMRDSMIKPANCIGSGPYSSDGDVIAEEIEEIGARIETDDNAALSDRFMSQSVAFMQRLKEEAPTPEARAYAARMLISTSPGGYIWHRRTEETIEP